MATEATTRGRLRGLCQRRILLYSERRSRRACLGHIVNDARDNADDLPSAVAPAGAQSSAPTSRSLLDRVRSGEVGAWERLLALYGPLVFHWCRRRDLQDQDIADVFQEVFLAVTMHIGAFRKQYPTDTFRGWLRRITTNKINDHYRLRGAEPGGVGGTDANLRLAQLPGPVGAEEDGATDQAAERALFHRGLELIRSEFEERTWQAFWRTAVEGRAAADVAAELGMSPGAVRVAKSRVLHRLREELGDLPG
jgi:RNA polymerase sigma-70 factor (ECF subfamily)